MTFTLKKILTSTIATLALLGVAHAGAEVRLKLGHVAQPSHPFHTGALKLAELAKQYSNGELIIDVFPASQIGNERDLIEGARLGTIDMLLTSTAPVMGFERDSAYSICLSFSAMCSMRIRCWMARSESSYLPHLNRRA